MTGSLEVPSRSAATRTLQQYGLVVLSLIAALGLSLALRGYVYPRPLFILALVFSIFSLSTRGFGPGLLGAGLATLAVRLLFPEWLPHYGLVSDGAIFGAAAVAVSIFRSAKLREEARRNLIEEQLQVSQQRLTLAQSAAHLGGWERDLRTNALTISGEYGAQFGLTAGDPPLTFEKWMARVHPDDRERIQALLEDTIERTHVWDAEFRVVWPDGSIRWLLGKGTVLLDDTGKPVRIAGVNIDITDRKRAEAALHASELQYKEVFDNISACMFLVDVTVDGRFAFISFNPAEEKAVGLSSAQVSGKFVEEVFNEELAAKLVGNYRRCVENGAPIAYDDELDLPGGQRSFHSNLIPMRNAEGRIHLIVGVCIDTTDQKEAEVAARRSLEEIAHLNRVGAMGELTASLAHELNQPLAAILVNAQAASRYLSGEPPDFTEVRECLTEIVADDKRAGEVIQRLRTLLKKEQSQSTEVDLNEVVADVIRLVRNDALLRQTTVAFESCATLPPIVGDRVQLYQVVLNLIVNALDAAADRPVGSRRLWVRTAQPEGGGVQLTVEDSGTGIDENDLPRVFEPFFSTKREGLGMGLSISRSIVLAHGGRLWAENNPDGGAIFKCTLPLAQKAAAASASFS
jgi:PAS domain S-box-containing protein